MSSWVTDEKGKWHPAKEVVGLVNRSNKTIEITSTSSDGKKFKQSIPPGSPYTYEGPCRAALLDAWESLGKPTEEEMKKKLENKELTIGEDFRRNAEFLQAYGIARQAHGFSSVDEYLKYMGYDEEKAKKQFEEKAAKVTTHELPSRVNEIRKVGGGDNRATPGQNIMYGGFGEPPELR